MLAKIKNYASALSFLVALVALIISIASYVTSEKRERAVRLDFLRYEKIRQIKEDADSASKNFFSAIERSLGKDFYERGPLHQHIASKLNEGDEQLVTAITSYISLINELTGKAELIIDRDAWKEMREYVDSVRQFAFELGQTVRLGTQKSEEAQRVAGKFLTRVLNMPAIIDTTLDNALKDSFRSLK